MRITLITPGSGDHFYCENCRRDLDTVKALRAAGHDAMIVPLYLPINTVSETPVFYGAVNVYLEQILPGYRRLPRFVRRWLDALPVLRFAADRAGSTRAGGLEELTLSVLRGEDGRQADELSRLSEWLATGPRPDVLHISNALLAGLAGRLRETIKVPIVCSLQDEDTWVDTMPDAWRERIWNEMADRCAPIDHFIAVSHWYAGHIAPRLGLSSTRVSVVYPGIDVTSRRVSPPPSVPTIGYFSRLSAKLGLNLLVEAFLALRGQPGLEDLRLVIAGGMTGDDEANMVHVRARLAAAEKAGAATITEAFTPALVAEVMSRVTVLTVPIPEGEAFGLFAAEAMSYGVPVVLPTSGAFPEILELTGGGLSCEPGSVSSLAEALAQILRDPALRSRLSQAARTGIETHFDLHTNMTPALVACYASATP